MKKRRKVKGGKGFWQDSLDYLNGTRNYVFLVAIIFLISAIFGFLVPEQFTYFDALLKELVEKTQGMDFTELTWFIFKNNITSSFMGLILGFFFGLFPIFISLFNGVLLGYVYARASAVAGFQVIWMLVPHGIFELPAVFISLGLGLRFGMFIFAKEKKAEFVKRLLGSLKVFFGFVLPLLVIAAIIEGILIIYF